MKQAVPKLPDFKGPFWDSPNSESGDNNSLAWYEFTNCPKQLVCLIHLKEFRTGTLTENLPDRSWTWYATVVSASSELTCTEHIDGAGFEPVISKLIAQLRSQHYDITPALELAAQLEKSLEKTYPQVVEPKEIIHQEKPGPTLPAPRVFSRTATAYLD